MMEPMPFAPPQAKQWEVMETLGSLTIGYTWAGRDSEAAGNLQEGYVPPPTPAKTWREHHMFDAYKAVCAACIELDSDPVDSLSPLALTIKEAGDRVKEQRMAELRKAMETRPRRNRGRQPRPDGDGT
jgi:hypothetical protein